MIVENSEKVHQEIALAISLGSSYIDALVDYSVRSGIDVEHIAEMVKRSPLLMELVRVESAKLRLIKEDYEEGLEKFFD